MKAENPIVLLLISDYEFKMCLIKRIVFICFATAKAKVTDDSVIQKLYYCHNLQNSKSKCLLAIHMILCVP